MTTETTTETTDTEYDEQGRIARQVTTRRVVTEEDDEAR